MASKTNENLQVPSSLPTPPPLILSTICLGRWHILLVWMILFFSSVVVVSCSPCQSHHIEFSFVSTSSPPPLIKLCIIIEPAKQKEKMKRKEKTRFKKKEPNLCVMSVSYDYHNLITCCHIWGAASTSVLYIIGFDDNYEKMSSSRYQPFRCWAMTMQQGQHSIDNEAYIKTIGFIWLHHNNTHN